MIYFDHNASSLLLPEARAAWLEAEERFPGNPSSPHRLGARAERALEQARERVAGVLGCSPLEVVWTSGATEACNTVLQHAAAMRKAASEGRGRADAASNVWVSAVEHPAVRESARVYFGERLQTIPVRRDGVVDIGWIEERLRRERPALVAVMAANNETGVLQPWQRVHEVCAASGVAFFCDATQWCGREAAAGLGACDFVAGSAHKFGGPRGVGFLKSASGVALRPLVHGGGQQERRRAGTENVAGVLAMVAALEWCERQIAAGAAAERRAWRERFERELVAALPGARVNGAGAARLWNTVSAVMPEADCRQRWVVKLDKAGFAVSTGSACASGTERPSPVLTAMGLSASEAGRALRFSAGWLTEEREWTALVGELVRVAREMSGASVEGGREGERSTLNV